MWPVIQWLGVVWVCVTHSVYFSVLLWPHNLQAWPFSQFRNGLGESGGGGGGGFILFAHLTQVALTA